MRKWNEWLAVKLTQGVGSMTCAYVFFIWSLLPLAFPSMQGIVSYVSQSIIQLVLLSVIMVGQSIGDRAHEKRDNESHDAVIAEFAEIKVMHAELRQLLQQQKTEE